MEAARSGSTNRTNLRTGFAGSLSVRRSSAAGSGGGGIQSAHVGANASDAPTDIEPYMSSLAKLFPVESVTTLLLVLSIDEQQTALRLGLITVIAFFSGLLRYYATRDPNTGKADLPVVGVAIMSFLIYAVAMLAFGGFIVNPETTRLTATIVAILWMAIVPEIIRNTQKV